MELRRIVTDKEKRLRNKCKKVAFPYSSKDIDDCKYLLDYLIFADKEENQQKYNIRAGVGLAAPQIGIEKRMIAVYIPIYDEENNIKDYEKYALINPEIVNRSVRKAYLLGGEGCLSVNEEHPGYAIRNATITVKGYDCLANKDIEIKLRGYEAIVFQHELDHLDGILFYDRINKDNPLEKIPGALEI